MKELGQLSFLISLCRGMNIMMVISPQFHIRLLTNRNVAKDVAAFLDLHFCVPL